MLISCIMPTRGRPALAAVAVEFWRSQTYQPTELVVIDDMDAPSFPGGLSMPGVQYHMLRRRLTIGEKRNLACSRATGEIICHHDDDDVYFPSRLSDQFERLLETGRPVTGYNPVLFHDGSRWWEYRASSDYAIGSSLMYQRSWWAAHPFNSTQIGEDSDFIAPARMSGEIAVSYGYNHMYATIHPLNTSPRDMRNSAQWRPVDAPQPEFWRHK